MVELRLVEEVHRCRVAAVFSANAGRQPGAGGASLIDGDAYQAADAVGVEGLERGSGEEAAVQVGRQEGRFGVVAGQAPGGGSRRSSSDRGRALWAPETTSSPCAAGRWSP